MNETEIKYCPACGAANRPTARFCKNCQTALIAPTASEAGVTKPAASSSRGLGRVVEQIGGLVQDFISSLAEELTVISRSKKEHSRTSTGRVAALPTRQLTQAEAARFSIAQPLHTRGTLSPMPVGTVLNKRYYVAQAFPLKRSNYYHVHDLRCRCGQINPTSNQPCIRCHTPLPQAIYILRERPIVEHAELDEVSLRNLSRDQAGLVPHERVWTSSRATYVLLLYLPQWRNLVGLSPVQEPAQIIHWGVQLGQALDYLHSRNFVHFTMGAEALEEIIIHNDAIRLADLSACRRILPEASNNERRALIGRDVRFLARALYYLATGRETPRTGNYSDVPSELSKPIARAMRGDYTDIEALLTALTGQAGRYGHSLKPVSGKATHEGRVRTLNEDALFVFEFTKVVQSVGVPVGLYLVADGMGGHQAGEIAAQTVGEAVTSRVLKEEIFRDLGGKATRKLGATPGSLLVDAIQEANRTLYRNAREQRSDMGTTLTAALIVGDMATIANVGDSRTYLLRRGTLRQITTDHSLVASLAAAGVITEEEIYTHPQRNQIYRTIGDKPEVDVDLFIEELQPGDQLILCSDGLWEMVRDPDISAIVSRAPSPQAACDALVRAANAAGGEDNVTVIVVEIE